MQPRKLRLCRAVCAFARSPRACRLECPDPAEAIVSTCDVLVTRCEEACAAAGGDCGPRCGVEALDCLDDQAASARACRATCRRPRRLARLECRIDCYGAWESGIIECLRDAPVCLGAARATYRACRTCADASSSAVCRRTCRRTYLAARRACLAHPESGLFACVPGCTGSAIGAFVVGGT